MNLHQERRVRLLRGPDQPLPFKKAKRLAESKGCRLISNRVADSLLHSYMRLSIPEIFWTGTIVAYPRTGEPFPPILQYNDSGSGTVYIFEIPKRFRGKKDSALVMFPDGYTIGDNGRKFREYAPLVEPVLMEGFPTTPVGAFGIHPITQLPVENGTGIERELWRTMGQYIGPVVRMHADHEGENWRDNVYICLPPSRLLPVIVEEIIVVP